MIKLTYQHYCDFCTKLIDTETYSYAYGPGYSIPLPNSNATISLGNGPKQLCGTCAAPIKEAMSKVIKDTLDARHPPREKTT